MKTVQLHEGWHLREAGEELWWPATVPGQVHLDLLAAGQIEDPFVGDRERAVAWVGQTDWEYRLRFDTEDELRALEHLHLVFDGIDTYATVRLNGQILFEADNMFRPWSAPVKGLLRARGNELSVLVRSPLREVAPRLANAPHRLPCPNDQAGGTCPYTRKAQYHYGWDWGPCLVTGGLWRGVRLEGWNEARLADVEIRQAAVTEAQAELEVEVQVEAAAAGAGMVRLSVGDDAVVETQAEWMVGTTRVKLAARIVRPRLWWPAGYGDQPLYRVRVELSGSRDVQAVERRIGLRTLAVDRSADAAGERFAFVVNGVPVFARGANWIPADSLTARVTPARYRSLLEAAREANLNMVRVWGGGIYEEDAFYDLCDELGLLVWQDFMFACALYPGDAAFIASVRAEAEYQVCRLRHRACLALWCGNNEVEWGWFSWGWKDTLPASVWEDYQRLFDDLLPDVCRRLDPGRLYWPSSPASDVRSSGDPNAAGRGDMHYWEVWGDPRATPEAYQGQRPRFASEFGFQAFPSPRTVAAYAGEGERAPDSAVMLAHQKAGHGNDKIRGQVQRLYGTARNDAAFCWLSQLVQAEYLRTALEHFRSLRPHCMGALYWQLNDCWPVASWSSVDYFGRWKAMHYAVRRACAPVMVAMRREGAAVSARVVSDLPHPVRGELTLRAWTADGRVCAEATSAVEAPAHGVSDAATLETAGCAPPPALVTADWRAGTEAVASQPLWLVEPKQSAGAPGDLSWHVRSDGVEVAARCFVPVVLLEAEHEGRFEDNFFALRPGEARRIAFVGGSPGRIAVSTLPDLIEPCAGS